MMMAMMINSRVPELIATANNNSRVTDSVKMTIKSFVAERDHGIIHNGSRDISVSIASRNGLDSPGIGSRAVQTGPEAHPAPCKTGTGAVLVVRQPDRGNGHSLLSSAGWRMGWSCTSASPL